MANIGSFDATTVAPREDFSAIPAGEYLAQIVDSDMKPTKNNNGQYAELTFEIMDGEFKSRRVWARLNLDNPSAKAVEIAQRDLSAICRAVGKLQIRDTQELHYKPMVIRIEVSRREGYPDSNEIKAYKASGTAPAQSSGGQASAPAPSDGTPPWQRAA
jgi:hypothetical protein